MTNNKNELKEERAFIHSLATPLGTAMLLTESLLDDFENSLPSNKEIQKRLKDICECLEKLNTLMVARRKILIEREGENGKN